MKAFRVASVAVYAGFILAAFILPAYSFPGYSLLSNTTSHLGAQGSPHAGIMNLIFIALAAVSYVKFWKTGVPFHRVVGALFAMSLALTGLFPHAPLVQGVKSHVLFDAIHSVGASSAGFCFTFLAFGHGIMNQGSQRILGIAAAIAATVLSVAMAGYPPLAGLFQRLIFMLSFGWILFLMRQTNPLTD